MSDLMRWADGFRVEIAIVVICAVPYLFIEIDSRYPLPAWVRWAGYTAVFTNLIGGAVCFTVAMLRMP